MLGAYNVNGASCELLIDQEALVWWPRAATANSNTTSPTTATSVKPNNLSSPLRHLRSLSRGGSSNTGSSGDFDDSEELQRRRRRIDFGQIIGVTKVYIKRRGRSKKRPSDRNQATISDEIGTATTTTTTSTPIKQRNDSEIREQAKRADSSRQLTKLKIYYAKKNEKRSTGRLLKLKKVTLGLLQSSHQDHDNSIDQSDSVHQTSPPTSSTTTTTSTSDSSSLASQWSPWPRGHRPDSSVLNDLYELIEQHLELKRRQRPRRLLVFVNPFGGKGKALHLYKSKVRKILDLAQVECQLVVTKYANHARNTIEDPMFNLEYFDGIICIGGDGMFAELMNGLLFRFNRDKLLSNELNLMNRRLSARLSMTNDQSTKVMSETETSATQQEQQQQQQQTDQKQETAESETLDRRQRLASQLGQMRSSLGGIGEQFQSPNIPIGVIGAGSTDANLFGFIGTNDTVSATLNIILGNQIQIDVCSIHSIQEDRLLRFVSTFVAYGYFGDVIRESEKLRWLGPSRYDVTALNSLIKYRCYDGLVRIVRSARDGTPLDLNRCHLNCGLCKQTGNQVNMSNNNNLYGSNNNNHLSSSTFINDCDKTDLTAGDATEKQTLADGGLTQGADDDDEFEIIEEEGSFVGVNAAVTACRCPQTRKGFSPGNHLANGCADLILVRPCSRMQYINYLIRTGYTSKSAFDLRYVDAYRCRQFEFLVKQQQQQQPQLQPQQHQSSDRRMGGNSATDDIATSDYQSKGSTKLSTNDTSIASSRQSSNANSLDSKHFADHHMTADLPSPTQQPDTKEQQTCGQVESSSGHDPDCDELGSSSSWNADGEILREQSIRVKVNNKLLRVFGTGEPQPRSRCQRKQ